MVHARNEWIGDTLVGGVAILYGISRAPYWQSVGCIIDNKLRYGWMTTWGKFLHCYALTPARQTGTRFIPGRIVGIIDLGDLLHTEMFDPPTGRHRSPIHLCPWFACDTWLKWNWINSLRHLARHWRSQKVAIGPVVKVRGGPGGGLSPPCFDLGPTCWNLEPGLVIAEPMLLQQ